jgi:sulfur carrier protein ThiS adenylyltransferase
MNPVSNLQPQPTAPPQPEQPPTEQPPTEQPPTEQQPQTQTEQPPAERNTRFRDILKPEVLKKTHAVVVGVGAIGRQLALQLSSVGAKNLWFIDPDTVEIENLGAQGFLELDMGKPKVDAVREMCLALNGQVNIKISQTKFRKEFVRTMVEAAESSEDDDPSAFRYIVFSCVDDMKARKSIWTAFTDMFISEEFGFDPRALFVDSRMGSETARVLAVSSTSGVDYYPRTLFEARDGLQQSCTSKTTIYCANLAAAMIMGQFSKFLRGMMVDRDILYNIFTADMMHDSEDLV